MKCKYTKDHLQQIKTALKQWLQILWGMNIPLHLFLGWGKEIIQTSIVLSNTVQAILKQYRCKVKPPVTFKESYTKMVMVLYLKTITEAPENIITSENAG